MSLGVGLAIAGIASLVAGALVLRSIGPGYRIGRLLAATPMVSIDEAIAIAREGATRYVRVSGRISSDEEFPDDQDRPLVFRRTRIELADPAGTWQSVFDDREAVPFGLETRSSFIGIDDAGLAEGLVVIPRESVGKAGDLRESLGTGVPVGTDPSTPARLVIDQLSAVEHATAAGVPVMRAGQPLLAAGLGRPLIITSLEQPAAMRLLARGRRGRAIVGAFGLAGGAGLIAVAVVAFLIGR
jgi:hypothetical protein